MIVGLAVLPVRISSSGTQTAGSEGDEEFGTFAGFVEEFLNESNPDQKEDPTVDDGQLQLNAGSTLFLSADLSASVPSETERWVVSQALLSMGERSSNAPSGTPWQKQAIDGNTNPSAGEVTGFQNQSSCNDRFELSLKRENVTGPFNISDETSAAEEASAQEEHAAPRNQLEELSSRIDGGAPSISSFDNPNGDASPAIQIFSHITERTLPGGREFGAVAFLAHVKLLEPAASIELKSLQFMLQPEELGEVEVTLRRVGQETRITLTVGSTAALDAIQRDIGVLEERLAGSLSSNPSVTISTEIRLSDSLQPEQVYSPLSQGPVWTETGGGRGFGRDGRNGTDDQQNRTGNGKELSDEDPPSKPVGRAGRVV